MHAAMVYSRMRLVLLVAVNGCATRAPSETSPSLSSSSGNERPGTTPQSQPTPKPAAPTPSREQALASERAAATEEALDVLCRIAARQQQLHEEGRDYVSANSPSHGEHDEPDVETGWVELRLPTAVRCSYQVRHTLMGIEPVAADIVDASQTPWWYAAASCHDPAREVILVARNDDARVYNESPTTRRQALMSPPRIPDDNAANDTDYRCTGENTWVVETSPRSHHDPAPHP